MVFVLGLLAWAILEIPYTSFFSVLLAGLVFLVVQWLPMEDTDRLYNLDFYEDSVEAYEELVVQYKRKIHMQPSKKDLFEHYIAKIENKIKQLEHKELRTQKGMQL